MPDKIINHLISNYVLIPLIEPLLYNCNVATRKNKGTSFGIYFVKKYINQLKFKYKKIYCLKIDIKKYFYNIDHQILLDKLKRIVKDKDIYRIVRKIIRSSDNPDINKDIRKVKKDLSNKMNKLNILDKDKHLADIKKLPEYKVGKGLPIGNLSSQILAIYYLHDVDYLIKEKLNVKHYIRYMDDFVLLHYDRDYLKYCLKQIKRKINSLKLDINDKTNIYDLEYGFSFLGYRFRLINKKLQIRISNQTKRRIKKKVKNLKIYDKVKLIRVKASYKGYLMVSNCNILKILK